MRYLIVDLEAVYWGPVMGGMPPHDAPRSIMASIRLIAKDFDRIVCVTGGHEDGHAPCTGRSFRSHYWPEYKADRKERSEDKWAGLAATIVDCRALGWPVIEAPAWDVPDAPEGVELFYEGDDVAATCAAYIAERGDQATILTCDSDLAQCVGERVDMIRRLKTGELVRLDAAGVEKWLGVAPSLVAEMKALAGDADGYKPFPGIAEGNARKMLATVAEHTAAAVVAYVDAMAEDKRNAYHRAIAAGAPNLERAYIAARAVTNVPIDLSLLSGEVARGEARSITSGMVADGDFDEAETNGEPAQPSTGMVLSDVSARMIAPAAEADRRMKEFSAFVKNCMVRDVDFGVIPGTPKPTLFKPGAEKLCEIYGFAAKFTEVRRIERWEGSVLFYYVIKCTLVRKIDGMFIAECLGSCNTWESKYRDRWVFQSEIPDGLDGDKLEWKDITGKGNKTYRKFKVPNPAPFDLVNTALKMAEKRAHVGATILATRSGGVFAQDLDTIPREAFGETYGARQWDQG